MSARTRLGLFGLTLLAVFVVGFLGGSVVGPLDGGRDATGAPHVTEETGPIDER